MTNTALFATYLHDTMNTRRMPPEEFEHELGSASRDAVQSWLNGWASPEPDQLPDIARALQREPVEVASAWLIDQLPELHAPLYAEVLEPRHSRFPAPGDLAVRTRAVRRPEADVSMGVGDPHDASRSATLTIRSGEGHVRKRPPIRRSTHKGFDDE